MEGNTEKIFTKQPPDMRVTKHKDSKMLAKLKIKRWKNIGTDKEEISSIGITVRLEGFRDTLFADDIVEVINYSDNKIIGNRYYIKRADATSTKMESYHVTPDNDGINMLVYSLEPPNYHRNLNLNYMASSQLVLWKRPLKNWFKYFWLLRTKKYINKDVRW